MDVPGEELKHEWRFTGLRRKRVPAEETVSVKSWAGGQGTNLEREKEAVVIENRKQRAQLDGSKTGRNRGHNAKHLISLPHYLHL